MGLPAPILSGPSILYLGLAAHKYSNKVHLSMLLLEEMLCMKWREYRPPFTHPTWHWQIYRNIYDCTSLLSSTFALTLAFSCLLIGFIPSDIFNQPRLLWADWQIGSVITTTQHARWGQFFILKKIQKKKKNGTLTQWHLHKDICVHRSMTAHMHKGTVWYGSRVWPAVWACYGHCGFALWSSALCVLFTADRKFH